MTVINTNQHYDQDPAIFELFLDPRMKYTCGLYKSPEDTLALAQENKLHYIAEKLNMKPGGRLLDIGSGWGSLSLFMAAEYGSEVVGVSPAPRQCDYVARRAQEMGIADRVSLRVSHVENLDLEQRGFDAVAMVGSSAHLSDIDGVFAACWSALRRGGRVYLSDSCYRNPAKQAEFAERDSALFVKDAVFGGGDMRPLATLVAAAEGAGFSIVAVDDLTDQYRRTIEDWMANVERNADALDAIEDGLAAKLLRYFEIANAGWGFTTKHYALVCGKYR
jgi:cyclopropane-fatty-acyl-phospholipid synthase